MTEQADGIAVVGLAAWFPGARDAREFWRNLAAGREAVRFPADEELRAAGVPDDLLADPDYVKAVVEAPDLGMFDAEFFGFTPRDAAVLDPQIRMFLEVAHRAVEDAGYDPHRIGDGTGVFGGVGVNRYVDLHVRDSSGYAPNSTEGAALSTLTHPDYLATHLSYRFGFRGPAMTVSTACSSSAMAVHLACQALRTGECDLVLAGGSEAEIPVHSGYLWSPGGPMSPDGHCRPFDRQAAGTVFGTGAGAVLLKRLGDALADGDDIRAVIRGSATTNDGSAKAGFTAPGVAGQAAAVREAMLVAGVTAPEVSYLEAHATGTALGDPIEVAALGNAYRSLHANRRTEPVLMSSVKGNIGHLGHASGVASLIKLVLCLEHEQRAATANFTEPNPRLELADSPFEVTNEPRPWPKVAGRPRLAGLNSSGFGGTNVHLVVEEAPAVEPAPRAVRPRVVVWSGRQPAAEHAYRDVLAAHLAERPDRFADTVGVLQDGRTPHRNRAAVVAQDAAGAAAAIAAGPVVGAGEPEPRPVALVFPGQAAQHALMAAGLYGVDPAFTETLDACFTHFTQLGVPLRDRWLAGEELTDTTLAQPLLFAVEYALAALWRSWGVTASVVLGHSVGELTAAAVAGVLSLADAAALVTARATAMAAMPPGGMLAVRAPEAAVAPLLPAGVTVAVVNDVRQTVVAGPHERLAAAAAALTEAGLTCRELATSHAFHSDMMGPAAEKFALAFDGVRLAEPVVPMISAATGGPVRSEVRSPEFFVRQLTEPVRFDLAADRLLAERHLVLEVGPGRTLTRLLAAHPAVRDGRSGVVPTLGAADRPGAERDDYRDALSAAAALWVEGHDLDWPAVRQHEPVRRLPVPGYQYQRELHWLPIRGSRPTAEATTEGPAGVPAEVAPVEAAPFSRLSWVEADAGERTPPEPGAVAVALLPDGADGSLLPVLALQRAGYRLAVLRPGSAYAEVGDEFRARVDHPDDLARVLDTLAGRGRPVRLVVHALGIDAWDRPTAASAASQLARSYHAVATLARAGARRTDPPALVVLASRTVDLTGTEPVDSVKATLHGAVRSLALEAPELAARLIDVAETSGADDLAAELTVAGAEPVVALRDRTRWVRTERPYHPETDGPPPVRRSGVYLLTGGLGGLGLAVARALARSGQQPTLVLLSRTGLADGPAGAEVAAIEALGAQVRVIPADVGDPRAMRRVLDTIRAHHGALHGVVHLAGVAGDGMLLVRDRADEDAVLWPKVAGTLVLEEVLAGSPPLDFFVSFSSRAAVDGLVGGADYAAANAFLDAHTRLLGRSGVPAVSVNWPAWHTVGMAADPVEAADAVWETELSAAGCPIVDEHRVDGVAVLPGTGHLDLVVRAARATIAGATAVRLTDVVFQQALAVPTARRVRVRFTTDGAGWTFTVTSSAGGPETVHTTGGLTLLDPVNAPTDRLAAARRLLTIARSEPADPDRLFTLGPRWANIDAITVSPDAEGEQLLELALPPAFRADLATHALHPALLDCATAQVRDPRTDRPHLPFGYESIEVHGDLPAEVVSHIRRRPARDRLIVADVDVYAPDGRLLVAVTGYTMSRVADRSAFTAGLTPDESPDGRAGIAPETGADLFTDLVRARNPYQVVVRPFRDGRPIPLAAVRPPAVPARPVAEPAPVLVRTADPAPVRDAAPATPAAGSVLDRLAALWRTLLGLERVADTDDFFDLGGNSLSAVELIGGIRTEFGLRLSIIAIFDNPTVAGLAAAIEQETAREGGR
jgi:acyl transferase domain-containing protein